MFMHAVLQVTPALDAGGVERTTIEVAEAITHAGGRALVASHGGQLEADLESVGGELVRLPMHTKNPLGVVMNAGRLKALAKKRDVALIHARSRAPAWSALWAARRLKLPFVTTFHGIYNAKSGLKRWYNSVMARGDIVIANSEYTRAHVLKEFAIDPQRVVTIPRGVDLAAFDPNKVDPVQALQLRAAWGIAGPERTLFLMPTRITRWKGHEQLLDAAGRVEAARPGRFAVVMAGSAQGRESFRDVLATRIASEGLGEFVRLVDHQNDMPLAILASDVVVTPSIEPEAFGRVAVEAQAMGRPVIASRHGGFSETVRDGESGLLTQPRDVEALARAMIRLIDADQSVRAAMGAAGMAHARPLYAKSALQKATLAVYEQLLSERR
jgi:glycosyltransferase involved in cell wall biosynthesis